MCAEVEIEEMNYVSGTFLLRLVESFLRRTTTFSSKRVSAQCLGLVRTSFSSKWASEVFGPGKDLFLFKESVCEVFGPGKDLFLFKEGV